MPELVLQSLDQVEDWLREAYREDDGQFVLDVDKFADLRVDREAKGLKTKVSELLGKLQKANERLKSFEGIEPDEVRSWKQEKEERELFGDASEDGKKGPDALEAARKKWAEDRRRELEKIQASFEAEKKSLLDQIMQRDQAIADMKVGSVLQDLAAKHEVLADRRDVFLDAVRRRFQWNGDEVVFLDKDGEPSTTSPEKAFAQEFRDRYPWAYPPSSTGGSGGTGGSKPRVSGDTVRYTREQLKDPNTYRRMREQEAKGIEIVVVEK